MATVLQRHDLTSVIVLFFFFQAEDGIRDIGVTGVQTCALPIFVDPQSGEPKDVGERVDVHLANGGAYRDMAVTMGDDDPVIGGDFTPYKVAAEGPSSVSMRSNTRPVSSAMFSSRANGDPSTPTLTAYPGDPVKVHAIGAPGSEQMHVFTLGGLPWQLDERIPDSQQVSSLALGPWSTIDADLAGGAGGMAREPGDFMY